DLRVRRPLRALLDRRRVRHAARPARKGPIPFRTIAARPGGLCALPLAARRELPAYHGRGYLHQDHRLLPPRRYPRRLVPARQGLRDRAAGDTRPGLRLGREEPLSPVRQERPLRAAFARPEGPPRDRRRRSARPARRRRGLTVWTP